MAWRPGPASRTTRPNNPSSRFTSLCLVSACAQNETRYAVDLNNFGFFADGTLDVNLMSLHLSDESLDFSAYPVSVGGGVGV